MKRSLFITMLCLMGNTLACVSNSCPARAHNAEVCGMTAEGEDLAFDVKKKPRPSNNDVNMPHAPICIPKSHWRITPSISSPPARDSPFNWYRTMKCAMRRSSHPTIWRYPPASRACTNFRFCAGTMCSLQKWICNILLLVVTIYENCSNLLDSGTGPSETQLRVVAPTI